MDKSSPKSGASPARTNAITNVKNAAKQGGHVTKALAKQALNNPKTRFAKDFTVEFGKNLGKTGVEIGKSVLKAPLRVATSLAEIPTVLKSGGSKTFKPYNVPFLGEVKTYSREAQDKIKAGDGSKMTTAATILGTGGQAILDTAALGSAAKGLKGALSKLKSGAGKTAASAATKTASKPSVANDVLAKKIENTKAIDTARQFPDSFEAASEKANGFIEGTKLMFDTALRQGDKLTVQALIKAGAIPKTYQKTFANEIGKVIGKGIGAYAK